MSPPSAGISAEEIRRLVCDAVRRVAGDSVTSSTGLQAVGAERQVITALEVEQARDGKLMVSDNALITPAANDRARELGVRFVDQPAGGGPLSPRQQGIADRLAEQLTQQLSGGELQELAFWCWNEGSCNDPGSIERIVKAGADRVGLALCAPPLDDAIAPLIDHTLLKPEATEQQVRELCGEALEFGFASVCINPYYVPLAADLLSGSAVRTCTVVGFPLGANMAQLKAQETRLAVEQGATEIDMVINIGALRSKRDDWVLWDIRQVVEAAHPQALVKVILESALLSDEEIVRACNLARDAGAEFVKTSTGFGPGGATAEDVSLMRRTVGRSMGVKASGGIGSRQTAAEMIAAGATRLGASAGVRIVRGE